MKKRILSIALLMIGLSIVASGTNAFYTAEETSHNVITTGNIDIELIELMETEEGEVIPFENVDGVMPGRTVSKIVIVKNTGSQPAYVKVKVEKTATLRDGSVENGELPFVTCDINTEMWTEKDGYYYYNEAVDVGGETAPLFTEVHFSKNMGNEYKKSKVELAVQAFATQVANNGDHALEALGWPEE